MKTIDGGSSFPWLLKKPKPRGLWVGKKRSPAQNWADPAVPEYYPNFYFRYQRAGRPQMFRAIDDVNVTTLKQAQEKAWLEISALDALRTDQLRDALQGLRVQRCGCTLGEFIEAFEAVAKARGLKEWTRARNSLRLVGAIAHKIMEPLSGLRMDREGGRLIRAVDALPAETVMCEATVMEYARLMQGGEVVNLDKNLPPAINGVINSTLGNARVPLSKQNRILQMARLPVDWPRLETFLTLTLPTPSADVGVTIPEPAAMRRMFADWRRLRDSDVAEDVELALCNELLRLLGLRSGEMVMARESWLHTNADGRCFLWVRNRAEENWSCKSSNAAKLPLSEDLAARLKGRCERARAAGMENPFLLLPLVPGAKALGKEHPDRQALVRERHNAWLKGFIGEVASGQGNHRLRKWCATRLYKLALEDHGDDVRAAREVTEYLRHSKEATALVHYIAKNDELLRTLTDEEA